MAKLKRKRGSMEGAPGMDDPYGTLLPACRIEDHHSAKKPGPKKKGPMGRRRLDNCSENPNCLFGLGEHIEGIWKAIPVPLEALGKDPSETIRTDVDGSIDDRSTPCGLRNLGATCYVNSMVQVLFMDLAFRKAVHEWQPNDSTTVAPALLGQMHALQRLFAYMQFSASSYADPQGFSNTLNLNEEMQQDAHEFTKLLLSHLQSIFVFSKDRSHWTFIEDHFRGQMEYVTTCMTCQSQSRSSGSYYDLSLNIKGHATVQDSFNSFLAPEYLEGENRYFCSSCEGKQEATRQITLDAGAMPPTLTLHLMRFVYDMRSMTKKKVQDAIGISRTLSVRPGLQYRLTAVLNHKGSTAHAGHYTATVYCPELLDWFCFNDTEVMRVSADDAVGSSKEAYMLIYTRMDAPDVAPVDEIPFADQVEASNRQLYRDVDVWLAKTTALTAQIETRKKAYNTLFETQAPAATAQAPTYSWVSTAFLKHWIQGTDIATAAPFVEDLSAAQCEHGHLHPAFARTHFKRLSPRVVDVLAPPACAVVSSATFRCTACVESWLQDTLESHHTQQELLDQLALLEAPPMGKAFVISRKWVNSWKLVTQHATKQAKPNPVKLAEAQSMLASAINDDLLCEHGQLQPQKRKQFRTVGAGLWQYFATHFRVAKALAAKKTAECHRCIAEASTLEESHAQAQAARDEVLKRSPVLRKLFKRRLLHPFENIFEIPHDVPFALVDRVWLTRWKEHFDDMDIDAPPPLDVAPFQCAHGLFVLPHNVKEIMRATTAPKKRPGAEAEIVTLDEYAQMQALYGGTTRPLVTVKQGVDAVIYARLRRTLPDGTIDIRILALCDECEAARDRQHLDFRGEEVLVVLLRQDEPVPAGTEGMIDDAVPSVRRRSNRSGRKPNVQFAVTCDADDTVALFKHKAQLAALAAGAYCGVLEHCDVDPSHQQLYFRGVELPNTSTLKAAGIQPQDTVYLQPSTDDLVGDGAIATTAGSEREQGFRFSAFHAAPPAPATVWVCSACTYLNEPEDVACDICAEPKAE
ncbi:ubiquitin-specific protease [Achlya hypogyna]|uniref:ubiquitinyl hydrolase 1 n=1 Tax=Achlya hypogyna TaxID=1202772 RepID=A0A1V9YFV4_ACHHY|nr:ubiquitin-specific protease [Achlya hypogyna]